MSLMDVKRGQTVGCLGLEPPAATPRAIWDDLRWHHRIYRMEGLDLRTRLGFLALRVVQRVAYNLGWSEGVSR
jgi:hypothetical protein